MKKLFLLLCLFTGFAATSFAQLGKMQFQDAEQAFSENKFEEAIQFLNEAEKSNGKTNPLIMHLRILSRAEVIKKDPEKDFDIIDKLRKEVNLFLKQYEADARLEDKYRDVYQVSKYLKNLPLTRQQFEDEIKSKKEAALKQEQEKKEKQNKLELNRAFARALYKRYSNIPSTNHIYPITQWSKDETKAIKTYNDIRNEIIMNIDPEYILENSAIPMIKVVVPGVKDIIIISIGRERKRVATVVQFE
jgi:hypothetical protein